MKVELDEGGGGGGRGVGGGARAWWGGVWEGKEKSGNLVLVCLPACNTRQSLFFYKNSFLFLEDLYIKPLDMAN